MKKIRVATHSGTFHADEVFALAVLKIYLAKNNKELEIVRTRDLKIIAECDLAVDVGEEYSHKKGRYDHHQKNKPKNRQNGIPYASFGLVWKHFGNKITFSSDVVGIIERKLVMSVDALDNGVNINPPQISGINTYSLHHILSAINSAYGEENRDAAFSKALEIASLVISGEIKKAEAKIEGERFVNEQIELQGKPDFLVLDKYTAWESAVSKNKKVKLVIFPDSFSTNWCLQVARDDLEVFGNDRINFPHNWRGLSDHELALTTQIPDAVFCHASGFYAVVKTKQAAITMASKVIREGL